MFSGPAPDQDPSALKSMSNARLERSPELTTVTSWSPKSLAERVLSLRDRWLANPEFHRRVLRIPFLRTIARRKARRLFDLAAGFSYSQVLAGCVELDLFELLAPGPKRTSELAVHVALPEDAVRCLLRAAAELELVAGAGDDRWRLGELGAASRGNPGIAAMVRHNQLLYRDLCKPIDLLAKRADTEVSQYWTYGCAASAVCDAEASAPDNAGAYSDLMAQSQSFVADDVLAHAPLANRHVLLDVGGGSGFFAAQALQKHKHLRVQVFDRPTVAPLAQRRFSKENLDGRSSVVAGDMFREELPRGADVISFVRVLHDHDDDQIRLVLSAARRAISEGGMILIAEPMAETRSNPGVGVYFHMYLRAMRSGRPRSKGELTGFLEDAGFGAVREIATYQPLLVRLLVASA
ncbi:MAG: methyltransferase [Pseudomonadota bacterium]